MGDDLIMQKQVHGRGEEQEECPTLLTAIHFYIILLFSSTAANLVQCLCVVCVCIHYVVIVVSIPC